MKKTMEIEGMQCQHCCNRVNDALNDLVGVHAVTDLFRGIAAVDAAEGVTDEQLMQAVRKAGYQVTGIKNSGEKEERFRGDF